MKTPASNDSCLDQTGNCFALDLGADIDTGDYTGSNYGAPARLGCTRIPRSRWCVGDILDGRYRVLGLIGAGGAGEVYDVERVELSQRCALKILRDNSSHDPGARRRFMREARMMARIESEHVTRIIDFGHLDRDVPFFVMERLQGEDLACLLRRVQRLPFARAVRIVIDACWGLNAVHGAGLVHRDIKPANLFVTRRDSGGDLCKVLDFGVSRSATTTQTGQGQLVGTLRYMAPEQVSDGHVDHRTDLYALAVVLFECIAGFTPHREDRIERILFSIMNREPPRLVDLFPQIPSGLSTCIQRGLARNPHDRFQSARDFAQALLPYVHMDSSPSAQEVAAADSESESRTARRLRWVWLVAIVVVCAGGVFVQGHSTRHSVAVSSGSAKPTAASRGLASNTRNVERIPSRPDPTPRQAGRDAVTPVQGQRNPAPRQRGRALQVSKTAPSTFVQVGTDIAGARIDVRNPYEQ